MHNFLQEPHEKDDLEVRVTFPLSLVLWCSELCSSLFHHPRDSARYWNGLLVSVQHLSEWTPCHAHSSLDRGHPFKHRPLGIVSSMWTHSELILECSVSSQVVILNFTCLLTRHGWSRTMDWQRREFLRTCVSQLSSFMTWGGGVPPSRVYFLMKT